MMNNNDVIFETKITVKEGSPYLATKSKIQFIMTKNDQNHTLYVIYFYAADCPKDSVLLQEGETVAYQWVDRKTLLEMSGRELISYREIACIKELDL